MRMIDSRLSNKFKWLSFVSAWAVVVIHARTDIWVKDADDYVARIQMICSDCFSFAVPVFFIISGYFFLSSYEKYGWKHLLFVKFKSLYLPALFWSCIAVLLCLPIRLYSQNDIPTLSEIAMLPLMAVFRSEASHFWYVRALIIFAIIAPLVVFCARRVWLSILIMALSMLLPSGSVFSRCRIPVSLFYFLAGCVLCKSNVASFTLSRGKLFSLLICCSSGVLFLNIFKTHYFSLLLSPALWIILLWFIYDLIDETIGIKRFPSFLNVTFFVYCMHKIIICWVGGCFRVLFGDGQMSRLITYYVLWLTFWIDLLIAVVVRKKFPRVYYILSGGR